jgi:hypothetical protein
MRVPSYRRHSSGNARVTINGKDHLLGKYGSKVSREKYNRKQNLFVGVVLIVSQSRTADAEWHSRRCLNARSYPRLYSRFLRNVPKALHGVEIIQKMS